MIRIEIDGPRASGKSYLADAMRKTGLNIYEAPDCYDVVGRHAFQTPASFTDVTARLLDHACRFKVERGPEGAVIRVRLPARVALV